MASAAVQQTNFGVPDKVVFDEHRGLVRATLKAGDACAEVFLHGAHVARWRAGGTEAIWMSDDARFAKDAPIRGGIPICWPQFGPGDLPQHGFLRNSSAWLVAGTNADGDSAAVTFKHVDNAETLAAWPHAFSVEYTVKLTAASLSTALKVKNTGTSKFEFTTALHTYFNIPKIEDVRVHGLENLTYYDKVQDFKECKEGAEPVSISKETDRVYVDAPEKLVIDDGKGNQTIIRKNGALRDAVLWNPWVEKAKSIADFHDQGFNNMVCVEAGAIHVPVTVGPGAEWEGSQTLSVGKA
ncbi:putative glucose-6-phosphate 1-epimerase [Diplonema papillatum]|nr:putative glucose-6-phosphate 1-epimerase [Diplonema papillatum]|eukprot:gene18406-28386_t